MGSTEQPPPPRTVTIVQDGKTIRMWLEPPSQDEAAPEEAQAGSPDDPRMLLAMLLSAVLGTTAAPVAATLLSAFGSLGAVLTARRAQLAKVPGMTDAAVRLLEAAGRILQLAWEEELPGRHLLDNWGALERYLRVTMGQHRCEAVRGLFLDHEGRLLRDQVLGTGTVGPVPLCPREVLRQALARDASGLILVHTHPSGRSALSQAEIDMTRQLTTALATVGITLHDQVIVSGNQIVSMRSPSSKQDTSIA